VALVIDASISVFDLSKISSEDAIEPKKGGTRVVASETQVRDTDPSLMGEGCW
jgi:hypothetical protein